MKFYVTGIWAGGGGAVGTDSKEVGGVRVVAGAEVGCRDGNIGAHHG